MDGRRRLAAATGASATRRNVARSVVAGHGTARVPASASICVVVAAAWRRGRGSVRPTRAARRRLRPAPTADVRVETPRNRPVRCDRLPVSQELRVQGAAAVLLRCLRAVSALSCRSLVSAPRRLRSRAPHRSSPMTAAAARAHYCRVLSCCVCDPRRSWARRSL